MQPAALAGHCTAWQGLCLLLTHYGGEGAGTVFTRGVGSVVCLCVARCGALCDDAESQEVEGRCETDAACDQKRL